jgi:hypothetical protein
LSIFEFLLFLSRGVDIFISSTLYALQIYALQIYALRSTLTYKCRPFGEDVVLAAPLVEIEAVQVDGFNSAGVMQVEVSWMVVE